MKIAQVIEYLVEAELETLGTPTTNRAKKSVALLTKYEDDFDHIESKCRDEPQSITAELL